MFVEIKLDIAGYSDEGSERREFWGRFSRAARGEPFSEHGSATGEEQIEELERRFRLGFPVVLQARANEEVRRAYSNWKVNKNVEIGIRLVTLEYGSLKSILDVTGIDNAELRDFVLSLLTIYAPTAFREALGEPLVSGISASANVVGGDMKMADPQAASRLGSGEALSRAWIIANTSLVLPVGLALIVCYYTFSALNRELELSRAQAASMQAERTELVKALQAQNAKLSDLLITHAGNTDKALSEILVAVTKSTSDRAVSPSRSSNP